MPTICEHFMTIESTTVKPTDTAVEFAQENSDDEFESTAEYHRMAAMHFSAAAKHHHLAAKADDESDAKKTAHHAFEAFRHQLNGVGYAEIAVMDNDNLDDEADAEIDSN